MLAWAPHLRERRARVTVPDWPMALAQRRQPAAAVLQDVASAESQPFVSAEGGSSLTPLALVAGSSGALKQQEAYRLAG